jgi:hypothetical protein
MTDETETPSEPKAKHGKRLLSSDWLEICEMARAGVPVAKIAFAHKVSAQIIYRGLKKRRVILGSGVATAAKVEDDKERAELIARIKKTRDADYRYTEYLVERGLRIQMQAQKDGLSPRVTYDDIKALKLTMDLVRAGTDNKWRILGLDKENEDADKELPELPIREMTEEEITSQRDRQLLDDAELEALEESLAAGGGEDDLDSIIEGEEEDIGGDDS